MPDATPRVVTWEVAQSSGWGPEVQQVVQSFLGPKATPQHVERLFQALGSGLVGSAALNLISTYQRGEVTKPGLYRALINAHDSIAQGKAPPSSGAPAEVQPKPPEQPQAQPAPIQPPVVPQAPVIPAVPMVETPFLPETPGTTHMAQASAAALVLTPDQTMNVSFESFPFNGLFCSICGEPQRTTPSGAVCKNGHGGAPGIVSVAQTTPIPPVTPQSVQTLVQDMKAALVKPTEDGNGFRRNSSGWFFLQGLRDGVPRSRMEVLALLKQFYPSATAEQLDKCNANAWSTFCTQMAGERAEMNGWKYTIQKLPEHKVQIGASPLPAQTAPVQPPVAPVQVVAPVVPTPVVPQAQPMAPVTPPPVIIPSATPVPGPGIFHTPETTHVVGPLDISVPTPTAQVISEGARMSAAEAEAFFAYRKVLQDLQLARARMSEALDVADQRTKECTTLQEQVDAAWSKLHNLLIA